MKIHASAFLFLALSSTFWGCSKNSSDSAALQSSLDFSTPEAVRASGAFGVYEDGWVGTESEMSLRNAGHLPLLWIEGTNVETKVAEESLRIYVLIVGDTVEVLSVPAPGDFRESVLLPRAFSNLDTLPIRLLSSKSFVPSKLGTSRDDRTLSFRLRRIELAPMESSAGSFPSSFIFPGKIEADPNIQGIYSDGWMADSASVTLYNPKDKKIVEIRGVVPGNVFKGAATMDVSWKGQLLMRQQVQRNFRIQLLLPELVLKESRFTLSLRPSAAFVPADLKINSDQRRISFQIESIGLK